MKIKTILDLKMWLEEQEEKWYSNTETPDMFGEFDLQVVYVPTVDNEGRFIGYGKPEVHEDPELGFIFEGDLE